VLVYTRPLRLALKVYRLISLARKHPKTAAVTALATFIIPTAIGVTAIGVTFGWCRK